MDAARRQLHLFEDARPAGPEARPGPDRVVSIDAEPSPPDPGIRRPPDAAAPAALGRPPQKLFRVSEIADHVGVTRQTIHNYATIGLITEERQTPGGQRLYDESVFPVLARIQRLKARHRLAEIRRLLEEEAAREFGLRPQGRCGPT